MKWVVEYRCYAVRPDCETDENQGRFRLSMSGLHDVPVSAPPNISERCIK